MAAYQNAVLFMEANSTGATDFRPLMLEAICSSPILKWMSDHLLADGVQRFFVVCELEYAEEVRSCFPAECDITISNQHSDLLSFLNTPDFVLVLNRSAVPFAQAGPGFVYAAPGYELQEVWKTKMTNAVQGAELVGGWLPVYGPETIAELEPVFQKL